METQQQKLEKTNFLDTIDSPKDLKLLDKNQLKSLATEIRHKIIDVVSKTGGHLGGAQPPCMHTRYSDSDMC